MFALKTVKETYGSKPTLRWYVAELWEAFDALLLFLDVICELLFDLAFLVDTLIVLSSMYLEFFAVLFSC